MNISSIKFVTHQDGVTKYWRCHHGVGRFRNLLVLNADPLELDLVAKSLVFALAGRKHPAIDEVVVELTDNAGDTWSIQRGSFGSRFVHNGQAIPVDKAQRSMLAALLDMDVGIGAGEGLVAPIVWRKLEGRSGRFWSSDATVHDASTANEPDASMVVQMLADECATLIAKPEYGEPTRLAAVSPNLVALQGRWSELKDAPLGTTNSTDAAPAFAMVEAITRELDHLQHIDFLCRRMGDSNESVPRLSHQIESIDNRLNEILQRWPAETLQAAADRTRWEQGLELLVRVRSYTRLTETATKLRKLCMERVKPAAEKSMSAWNDFLSGSKVTGQEVESCLASMLLGMKQLGLDLERLDEATPVEPSSERVEPQGGWFDRLKPRSAKPSAEQAREARLSLQHRDWLNKSLRDVESMKASIDYALKSVQGFADELEQAQGSANRGISGVEELAVKSTDELSRLQHEWRQWSESFGVAQDITLEAMATLSRDATEWEVLQDARTTLAARLSERLELQAALEAQVRHWWKVIGSDKSVDISNPAFLVAEARAALRHRETRRQRVQKIVKDAARHARDESLRQWNFKRRTEIQNQWRDVFHGAGLPPLEITDERILTVTRLGMAIQSMLQLQMIRDEARLTKSDLWCSHNEAAVRIYQWNDTNPGEDSLEACVQLVRNYPIEGDATVSLVLVADPRTAKALSALGLGSAISAAASGRAGAERAPLVTEEKTVVAKPSARTMSNREVTSAERSPTKAKPAPANSSRSSDGMSNKAAAALKILNPKASR